MKPWLKIALLACALPAIFSCVSTGVKESVNPNFTARLETGKSTQADVTTLLGDPTIVTYGAKGEETWRYYYVTESPYPVEFIPLVDALSPGFYQITKTLTVAYDRKGVLQKLRRTRTTGSAAIYPY